MLKAVSTKCTIMDRIVGSAYCMDCMFHNDTYDEPHNFIMCVFPKSIDK